MKGAQAELVAWVMFAPLWAAVTVFKNGFDEGLPGKRLAWRLRLPRRCSPASCPSQLCLLRHP